MAKLALKLSKADDVFTVSHRGYPMGGLLRFHSALGLTASFVAVPMLAETGPMLTQVYFFAALALLTYAISGYAIYLPFAAFGGRVQMSPKNESLSFERSYLSISTEKARQIPWEGQLETEVERVGFGPKFLPFHYFRVKVVTDFMTYHVATFGPGLEGAAADLAKAIKRARYGRPAAAQEY